MALITLGISGLAGLVMSVFAYAGTESLLWAFLAYSATGTLCLFAALALAFIKDMSQLDDVSDQVLFPAE